MKYIQDRSYENSYQTVLAAFWSNHLNLWICMSEVHTHWSFVIKMAKLLETPVIQQSSVDETFLTAFCNRQKSHQCCCCCCWWCCWCCEQVVVLHWIGKLGQNHLMFAVVVVARNKGYVYKLYFKGFFPATENNVFCSEVTSIEDVRPFVS